MTDFNIQNHEVSLEEIEKQEEDNIWIAASDGDLNRVKKYLINNNNNANDQDENGYSPLMAAVSYGHIELIDFLINQGASLELKDNDGDVALLYCENIEILKHLIIKGADISCINNAGESIIEKSIEEKNQPIIDYLLEKSFLSEEKLKSLNSFYHPKNEFANTDPDFLNLINNIDNDN